MKDNRTTWTGIGLAVCQALSLVPMLVKYQWIFQSLSIILTALLGMFAADSKKE